MMNVEETRHESAQEGAHARHQTNVIDACVWATRNVIRTRSLHPVARQKCPAEQLFDKANCDTKFQISNS